MRAGVWFTIIARGGLRQSIGRVSLVQTTVEIGRYWHAIDPTPPPNRRRTARIPGGFFGPKRVFYGNQFAGSLVIEFPSHIIYSFITTTIHIKTICMIITGW